MKTIFLTVIFACCSVILFAQNITPSVYVDTNGVIRWSDSQKEASFFGVNYTLPFAHAYRAAGYLDVDRKKAIDEDVYHFARLGFNAYRIHIWDVEISDSLGNLIKNEHLELLDYLINKLEERGIKILITAQTNFGNGYPERNRMTGGFSYLYNKCDIHSNSKAIAAQQRYLSSLIQHINPYNGKSYTDDPDIIGFEINNEPCHTGDIASTKDYINRMLETVKKTGNKKPVFYNVSHNLDVAEAYFETNIRGGTYQWYPTGLVAGHTRKGNFLPYVDEYPIPFSALNGFNSKARLVYEFDPADILYSYMYPAIIRSFRTAGFQWITQFAYDPMSLAAANTEYQTHYLNLAYTPGKAISMKIASEAAYKLPRGKAYGIYPADTVFDDFRVSYRQDLSEMNAPEKFFYSNNTKTRPVNPEKLHAVAGTGTSEIVTYEGTGAYFLDKLEDGIWRLEVMPDAVPVADPFARASLEKEVVRIYHKAWDMSINLPDLSENFIIQGLNNHNHISSLTSNGTIHNLTPGVYLLTRQGTKSSQEWLSDTKWDNIQLGEFAAPASSNKLTVNHKAAVIAENDKPLKLQALIAAPFVPDSILLYTNHVSFWRDQNPYYKMKRTKGFNYEVMIPTSELRDNYFSYNLVVYHSNNAVTYPSGIEKSPLDWDYTNNDYYTVKLVGPESPVMLFDPSTDIEKVEICMFPEWHQVEKKLIEHTPAETTSYQITFQSESSDPEFNVTKEISNDVKLRLSGLDKARYVCIRAHSIPEGLMIGFVTKNGFTYKSKCSVDKDSVIRIPISDLKQTETALIPIGYPVFIKKHFKPEIELPFTIKDIETLILSVNGIQGKPCTIETGSIWIE